MRALSIAVILIILQMYFLDERREHTSNFVLGDRRVLRSLKEAILQSLLIRYRSTVLSNTIKISQNSQPSRTRGSRRKERRTKEPLQVNWPVSGLVVVAMRIKCDTMKFRCHF